MAIIESGLMEVWKKKHWPKGGNKCSKAFSSVRHFQTKMEDIQGACIALVLGIGVSCVVFILEILVKLFQSTVAKLKTVRLIGNTNTLINCNKTLNGCE